MTVKQLKELLADAPEEMSVMVMMDDHTKPGMFAFAEACTCETGVSEVENGEKYFLVLPHGVGVSEDDIEKGDASVPGLN